MIALPMARVAVSRPDGETRIRDLFIAASTTIWLAYTYVYPTLIHAHTTLPVCPFYALTGHPCPFCGGTRSYSAMWRGDLLKAAHFYPLGPLLFMVTFPAAVYGLWALVSRRTVHVDLHPRFAGGLFAAAIVALLVSWTLKLFWLGN